MDVGLVEAYALASGLLASTRRHVFVDVGLAEARLFEKIDAARRVAAFPAHGTEGLRADDILVDSDSRSVPTLLELAKWGCVLGCFDLFGTASRPDIFRLLERVVGTGSIAVTRASVTAGSELNSADPASALTRFCRHLEAERLKPNVAGYLRPATKGDACRSLVSIHDARLSRPSAIRRPLAIIAVYNEVDIIAETVADFIAQGCDVALVDNWSDDGTWHVLQSLAQQHPAYVSVERFPANGMSGRSEWRQLLARKETLACQYPGRWILHADADEHWRSTLEGLSIAETLAVAQSYGSNRIKLNIINFRPTNEQEFCSGQSEPMNYFEFADHPMHFILRRAWLQGRKKVDLTTSGGHSADFENVNDFPYRLLIKHYPIRSVEQGKKKIFRDRAGRWSVEEQDGLGWHAHYKEIKSSQQLVWDQAKLLRVTDTFWDDYRVSFVSSLPFERAREQTSLFDP